MFHILTIVLTAPLFPAVVQCPNFWAKCKVLRIFVFISPYLKSSHSSAWQSFNNNLNKPIIPWTAHTIIRKRSLWNTFCWWLGETRQGRTERSLPRVLGSCSDYLHFVFTDPGPRAGKWVKLVQSFNKRLGTGWNDGAREEMGKLITLRNSRNSTFLQLWLKSIALEFYPQYSLSIL